MQLDFLGYPDSRTSAKQRLGILKSTYALFLKQGIGNTTMVQIAEAAGVTRRTLYNYYDNRELIAVDIQLTVLQEIGWQHILVNGLRKPQPDFALELARALLCEYTVELQYISGFELHFARRHESEGYLHYLRSISRQVIQATEEGNYNSEALLIGGRLFMAYMLRILTCERIRRGGEAHVTSFPFDDYEEEIRLFINTMYAGVASASADAAMV